MNDQSTVRMVIGVLGALALLVVAGGIYLTSQDRSIPDALIAMGSGAAASVGTLLARTGTNEPQQVEVVNVSAEPVPVDPVPAKRTRKSTK